MDSRIEFLRHKINEINRNINFIRRQRISAQLRNQRINFLNKNKNQIQNMINQLNYNNAKKDPTQIFNQKIINSFDEKPRPNQPRPNQPRQNQPRQNQPNQPRQNQPRQNQPRQNQPRQNQPNQPRQNQPPQNTKHLEDKLETVHQLLVNIDKTLNSKQKTIDCLIQSNKTISDDIIERHKIELNDAEIQTETVDYISSRYKLDGKTDIDIIISSTQYPGMGGAATNAYNLIKKLRCDGFRVLGIFINNEDLDVDPDRIGDIVNIQNKTFQTDYLTKLKDYNIRENVLILAKNYRAPYLFRSIYPNSKIVYMVAGVVSYSLYIRQHDIISFSDFYKNCNKHRSKLISRKGPIFQENKTIKDCDFIMTNSNLTKKIYTKHFPDKEDSILNVHNTSVLNFNIHFIPDDEKIIDLLFVVSSHRRTIKNSEFIFKFFKHKALKNFKKVIVGQYHEEMDKEGIENCDYYGFIDNKYVLKLMRQSKLLVIPSFNDSSPNVLYEALYNGCQILISKNIGNYNIFEEYLPICKDPINKNLDNWAHNALTIIFKHRKVDKKFLRLYQIMQEYNFKKFIIEQVSSQSNSYKSLNTPKSLSSQAS